MSPLEQSPSTTGFHFDAGNRCSDWITLVGFTAGYVQSFQDRSGGSGLFFQKAGEEPSERPSGLSQELFTNSMPNPSRRRI